jgi:di/tricarboxylate transporter
MEQHTFVFAVLLLTLGLFIWGKFRHDIVAVISLLVLAFGGVISAEEAFSGFSNPAVITVAAVLILSRGLQNIGLAEIMGQWVLKLGKNITLQVAALFFLVAVTSAFMNNIGALAVFMPIAIQVARKNGYSPSLTLMPLAFGSLFGGMITLIGTPPNILIASFRMQEVGKPFGMFDFAPVGICIAVVGLLFVSLIGWRLLPQRQGQGNEDRFRIKDYMSEVRVTAKSMLIGKPPIDYLRGLGFDLQLLGLIREKKWIEGTQLPNIFREGDILLLQANSEVLKEFVEKTGVSLEGAGEIGDTLKGLESLTLMEVVVMDDSPLINGTAESMQLRTNYGVNVLAIGSNEKNFVDRLDRVRFKAGDILLLQGAPSKINFAVTEMGCLPLADRNFSIGKTGNMVLGSAIFALSVGLIVFDVVSPGIAFTLGVTLMVLTKIVRLREIYTSIDWPIIVMLGAMIPLGAALETSGGADLIARGLLSVGESVPPWVTLTILLFIVMTLTEVVNNAACVVLMAPIGIQLAKGLDVSSDPFLMAIAVGASCAFLTPIGHQSNTLVMGPGGYQFTDYYKMGLPLSIFVLLAAVPLILYFWPL